MRLVSLLFAVAALAVAASAQGEGTKFKRPAIPETAAAPAGFVPAGWRVLETAAGDLDGDGRPDAALALAHDAEGSGPEDTWQEPRLLVIALRDASGRLKLSAVSEKAVLCRGCGGILGDPFAALSIERGAVVVQHYGGSRDRWAYVDRFRYQDGAWAHIGETTTSTDTLDLDYEESRDTNIVTGLRVETVKGRGRPSRRVLREIRAGRVERAPVLDGNLSNEEWPGLPVRLEGKEDVVQQVASWRGAADASARLGAVFRGGELYLRAEVTDDSVVAGDEVRLVGKNGQVVKPLETKTRAMGKGYVVESRYATKSLGIDEIEARINELKGYGAPAEDLPEDRVLRVAVEIVDADAGQQGQSVLSTSRGGRKHPATIRLTPRAGLPLLSDFDRGRSADVMTQQ